jgi:integrase
VIGKVARIPRCATLARLVYAFGEVKALRWREDVDLIARTITVNQQTRHSITTTPKGQTRRTIPMTDALYVALKRLETIREGFVVRNLDGSQKSDGQADAAMLRICRRAGLPREGFIGCGTRPALKSSCHAPRGLIRQRDSAQAPFMAISAGAEARTGGSSGPASRGTWPACAPRASGCRHTH